MILNDLETEEGNTNSGDNTSNGKTRRRAHGGSTSEAWDGWGGVV